MSDSNLKSMVFSETEVISSQSRNLVEGYIPSPLQ